MGKPRWLLSSWRFCARAHTHTPMILSTLHAQSSTPRWRPWETDHVETSEDNNPTHHVPNVHTKRWKVREGSDQLLNRQWQWDTTMPEVRATSSLSQQPSGEDTMITSLTEGYTEARWGQCITKASSGKATGTWDEGVTAKSGGISPNLNGAAAWLAGWVTTMPQQVLALPKQQCQRQDTEALHRLDAGACSPSLIVDFLPQVWVELFHESHSNADPSSHAEGQIKQQILFQIPEQAFQKHQPLMFLLSTTASTTTFAPSLPHQTRFLEWQTKGP